MARVVEETVQHFENAAEWKKVITKHLDGAMRHAELSQKLGRPAPVPAIVINGKLVFDTIPDPNDLKAYLDACLNIGPNAGLNK